MSKDQECESCPGHEFLNCASEQFESDVAGSIREYLDHARDHMPADENPEVKERYVAFPTELAARLLWLAAGAFVQNGVPGSEAIYELAQALEQLDSTDGDEDISSVSASPKLHVVN